MKVKKGAVYRVTKSTNIVSKSQIEQWILVAARAADSKKASDTVVLEMGDLLGITDAFVITSASNTRQVKTIVEEVEKQVKGADGPSPRRIEGLPDSQWVLMDHGDFVVHVFLDEAREFYDLERLWADAPRLEWAPVGAAAR